MFSDELFVRTFSFVTQLCVVWTLLSCVVRGAQPSPAIVEGVVVDGVTRVPIAGANVARGTTVVNTGSDGRFTIEAEGGATLRVTADGYLETDIDVDDQLHPFFLPLALAVLPVDRHLAVGLGHLRGLDADVALPVPVVDVGEAETERRERDDHREAHPSVSAVLGCHLS